MALVGAAVSFVALMGFAHTSPGRPLLRLLFGSGGEAQAKVAGGACPLGFDGPRGTPEERDAARRHKASKLRGETPAAARPALGFALDKTTRGEIEAWASGRGVACKPLGRSTDLDCSNVPAGALPDTPSELAAEALWFRFDAKDRLVGIEAFRYTLDAGLVTSEYGEILGSLASRLGSPTSSFGEPTEAFLSRGLLAQAHATYAFADYRAEALAIQINYGKYVIKESYSSLN